MKQLADGVWHLNTIALPNAVNAFLLEDVLVDAGTGSRAGRSSASSRATTSAPTP